MQLFNQINARKLGDNEYNVFKGLFDNWWFVGISILTLVLQIVMVYIGGRPMRTVPLTARENAYAIILAAMVLPWGVLCKLILPSSIFDRFGVDERPMGPEERFAQPMILSRRNSYVSNLNNSSGLLQRGSSFRRQSSLGRDSFVRQGS